ncbi:MAG: hypothetical protein IPO67_25180 [Deltaproteobacteria bacterium]|nr:hypothetical protein [Deltaproteobacteria bacterium]MBK9364946.1 hypothetical protein [Deltaproteobacteria bacterium]MBK9648406.1 hypothetical protein [Deltaproteobacteria bacterium]
MLRWGLIFIVCPLPLTEEQKLDLVRLAAGAYFQGQGQVPFDWPELRGELRVTGGELSLGSFTGRAFEADVHLPTRQGLVKFLVTEAQLRAAWTPSITAEA